MDRRFVLGGFGAGALALGGYAVLQSPTPVTGGLLPATAANAQTTEEVMNAPEVLEMAMGAEDAPVTVIEYASFTCPHCATFHATVTPRLKSEYVDEGLVRFIYREVYFDRPGLWASMVARCAGPERYFGVVDLLYTNQREWVAGEPAQIAENLRRIGRTAGLNDAELDACLSDGEMAQAMIDQYEAHMAEHEITGTPSLVIDGEMHSNMSFEDLSGILDARLAAAQ